MLLSRRMTPNSPAGKTKQAMYVQRNNVAPSLTIVAVEKQ
jgi:hypothetical protein